MSHKPEHIVEGTALGNTWDELYAQATKAGIDAEEQPIRVADVSKLDALQALAAVGGATVTPHPQGGFEVKLNFDEAAEAAERAAGNHNGNGVVDEPGVRAAAKPHEFA